MGYGISRLTCLSVVVLALFAHGSHRYWAAGVWANVCSLLERFDRQHLEPHERGTKLESEWHDRFAGQL